MEPIGAIAISLALDPQSQTTAPMQFRLLFRPVQHLKQHLRNVVAAIGVVFVRHKVATTGTWDGILTIPVWLTKWTNALLHRNDHGVTAQA